MKISQVVVFSGLGEDQNISFATDKHIDYGFYDQMKSSAIEGSKDYVSMRKSWKVPQCQRYEELNGGEVKYQKAEPLLDKASKL